MIRPELLDHLPPGEARPNLADLVRINRNFGGHSVIRKAMALVAQNGKAFTVLDVGAASGDTARLLQDLYPAARVVSLDCNSTNLEAAPQPKLLADAFELPFLDRSYDFVICSLFLHHFRDEQIVDLLRSFYRTARQAVVICDLERCFLPYCFLALTKPLFGWNEISVHDGLISVRAGFRKRDLLRLAQLARLENVRVQVHRPAFRLSMVVYKTGS